MCIYSHPHFCDSDFFVIVNDLLTLIKLVNEKINHKYYLPLNVQYIGENCGPFVINIIYSIQYWYKWEKYDQV